VLFAPLDLSAAQVATVAAQAVARGAAALLVERRLDMPLPQLIAPETRSALACISAAFYGYPAHQLGSIGVTGTDGKTTTTFLIDSILHSAGIPTGLIGSVALRVGTESRHHQTLQTTPEAPYVQRLLRRMVDAGARWAILEATSQGLAQHRLDEIPFSVAAITFITQDHLDFHGSIAAYRRAKAILFERIAETGGVAVINADDPAAREMHAYVGSGGIVSYSAAGRAVDVRATQVELGPTNTRFTLSTPAGSTNIVMPLLGEFNVANALCAAAVAYAVDVPLPMIMQGLNNASPVPGLLARIDAGQPFEVLIDEAKRPAQLVHALEVARQLAAGNRVILLVGGSDRTGRDQLRRKGQVAALAADYAVFTSQDPRFADPASLVSQITEGARTGGGRRGKTFCCLIDRREAIRHALKAAQPGDCVLLTGKGAEDEFTVRGETQPWDEAAIAREVLVELGYGEISLVPNS
jgi:UDP-N-acetylmuramoyl-L-alanyl-D-glutamate--2,6-diaminopimelate ligase